MAFLFVSLQTCSKSASGGSNTPDTVSPTVKVQNLRDKAVFESGFIIGTASDDVAVGSVEVSIDNTSSFKPAIGTTNWKFKIPVGGDVGAWRDWSKHTVNIRAKDTAGNYSAVSQYLLTKGTNRDVNGDGYADLVISAYNAGTGGQVYVFYGGASGLANTSAASAAVTLSSTTAGVNFGWAVSTSDLNCDGYGDVIVGAYGASSSQGKVYIFNGSANGISNSTEVAASTTLAGTQANGWFGYYAIGLDLNGDGYPELAVGAAGVNSLKGNVYVFSGSAAGISGGNDTSASAVLVGNTTNASFGVSLAAGDMNGDSYADLLIGAQQAGASNTGKAYVFYGSASGVSSANDTSAGTIISGTSANGYLAQYLATGDINGDGYSDIAVGAFGISSNLGKVFLFYGASSGISTANDTAANTIITGTQTGGQLGISLAIGDTNGDAYGDLLISAGGTGSGKGKAYLFQGTASGILSANDTSATSSFTGTLANGRFGNGLDISDLNGDGIGDLLIGANNAATFGKGYIYFGSIVSFAAANDTASNVTITGVSGANFGYRIW